MTKWPKDASVFQVLACAQHYNKFNLTSIYLIINYLEILIVFKIPVFIILLPTVIFNKNRKLHFRLKIVTMFLLGNK